MTRNVVSAWSRVAALLLVLLVRVSFSSAADDPWPKYSARCSTALEYLAAGRFADLESEFNTQMKQAVPASKLALAFNPLRQQLGDFDVIVAHRHTSTPGASDYTSFELWARFSQSRHLLKVDITFDQAEKIAALKLTPTGATSAPGTARISQQKSHGELELPGKPLETEEELASFLRKHPCEVGYFAKNLATGKTIDRFGERPVCLASIVKIFCLTELYRQVHEGNLDLGQEISVPNRGSVTLQEAADLMIGQSDNAATNSLADLVGHDNINRIPALLGIDSLSADVLPEHGVLQKTLDTRVFGRRIAKEGLPQHGTAKGIAQYFELLISRQVIAEEVSDQIIEFFKRHPKPFSIHYAEEYTFAGKGGNILWTRPPKHYSMMGWGLFVQDESGECTVLCVWGEWFPEDMPPPMQSELLKYVTDCVIATTGKIRVFTDSTGKFSVTAEYIDLRDGNVTLKKEDGKVISVPLAKLSEADRDWIGRQSQAQRNEKKTQPDGM